MPYSKNPYMPKVRARAVEMVKAGKSIRLSARHFGVAASTVSRWVKKSFLTGLAEIPTLSSRPKNIKTFSPELRDKVRKLRPGRTYEKVIKKLAQEGVTISLSSVKRIVKNLS